MNSTFDLKRFGKLIKAETLINKSTIVKLLLGLLLILLIVYYLPTLFGGARSIEEKEYFFTTIEQYNSYQILYVFVLLVPFFLYYNLYDKVKNVRYAMLPTSQLEKVISAVIQTSIISSALLMLVLALFLLIVYLTDFTSLELSFLSILDIEKFFETFFAVIQVQSFLFLGIFWFKNNKILKMILTAIAIITLLTVIGYIIANNQYIAEWLYEFFKKCYNSDVNDVLKFLYDHSKTILAILFPLLPWTAAFWKFKRTQI